MYAQNLASFLARLVKKGGPRRSNTEDEIVRETLVTRGGEVVHARVREALGLPAARRRVAEPACRSSSATTRSPSRAATAVLRRQARRNLRQATADLAGGARAAAGRPIVARGPRRGAVGALCGSAWRRCSAWPTTRASRRPRSDLEA